MNLMELKDKMLKKENIFPLVLSGQEVGIMEIYINEISRLFNQQIKRADLIKDALNNSKQSSLFSSKEYIYLIKDDKAFYKDEEQWKFLLNQNKKFILVYSDLDTRTRFFKEFEDKIVMFDALDAKQLSRYIIRDTGLDKEKAEQMAINCGLDYLTIKMEVDKLLRYKEECGLNINTAFEKAMKEKILQIKWEDLFEDFVDSVMRRNIVDALKKWRGLKQSGQSELKALAFIYNSFKQLLLVKYDQANLYFVNLLKPFIKLYSTEEIEDIIYILQKLELDVKTGKLELDLLVDYILVSIG